MEEEVRTKNKRMLNSEVKLLIIFDPFVQMFLLQKILCICKNL